MSDDKPTGTGTTVVNNDPWEGQRPYLSKGFATAEQFLNNPVQAYPNSTVVPQHSATTQALSGIRDRATSGSSLMRAGQDTIGAAARGEHIGQTPGTQGLQDTASGAYLDGNPHLQGIIDKAIRTSRASTDAQFAGSGRYGSGLHKGMAQDRMAEITSGVLAPAYESERNRMFNGFQIGQQAPRDALREYMATIGGGSYGGSTATTAPTYSDSFGKYLGYGAQGAGIAGSLFGKDGVFV
jgi:hypothetical protein